MFATYTNPNYELAGNWDSDSGRMLLWCPITGLSAEQKSNFDSDRRQQKLTHRLVTFTMQPVISLVMSEDIPTDTTSLIVPDIEEFAEAVKGDGLIIVEAKYLSQKGKLAMERCGVMIEDTYSEHMFERVQS